MISNALELEQDRRPSGTTTKGFMSSRRRNFRWPLGCAAVALFAPLLASYYYHLGRDSLEQKNAASVPGGERERHPKMIAHFGPPKTGSTTIFEALKTLEKNGALNVDNLHLLERYDMSDPFLYKKCLNDGPVECLGDKAPRLRRKFERHFEQGHNVIYADGLFSLIFSRLAKTGRVEETREFLETIIGNYVNNLEIVYVYRRYHEWLFSYYKQQHDFFLKASQYGATWDLLMTPLENCLGGSYVDNFADWIDDGISLGVGVGNVHAWYLHRTLPEYFADLSLRLVNMHRTPDWTEDFVCNVLPNSTESCSYFRNNRAQFKRLNVRSNLDLHYAKISKEAHTRLEFLECRSPMKMMKKIKHFHSDLLLRKDNGTAIASTEDAASLFLTRCPSPSQTDLLMNQSMMYEQELFPDFHLSEGGAEAIEEGFDKAMADHTYCDVDFDVLFNDTTWMLFFENIACPS